MSLKSAALALPFLALAFAPGVAGAAKAGDQLKNYRISAVLNDPEYQAKLPAGVKFYFADQPVTVSKTLGETRTSRKTSVMAKGPQGSCRWAMLSALIAIGEDAKAKGGNAVVGIQSNFANVPTSSTETFQCGVGDLMVGVALIGKVAVVD